ncbi:uncharacterized protein LOC110854540 [Folsomia candida]|uniref:Beta-lactamase n=1 Tax=Folsomia candida TaxID=158441 RepID=A0A226DUQ3_FOLCA|nr:uncharacterized protein LOC110854540 [Folsomia candida]OXA49225.1 Beta-lactamase [Folsomia candida]
MIFKSASIFTLPLLLFSTLILLTSAAPSAHPNNDVIPPEILLEIDTMIRASMERQHVPAFGVALVKGDATYAKTYGLRDVENNLPADGNTLFGIGSLSKAFAALVVTRTLRDLHPEMGEAVLDTPIATLAPSFNLTLGDRYRSEQVTFRDLLAHRVCALQELSGLLSQAYEGKEDFYFRYRYAPEECSFRNGMAYSNALIALSGEIVAHMVNSTYEELLTQLLNDLGMTGTTWIRASDDHNNMMHRAVPYIWKEGSLKRYNTELLKMIAPIFGGGGMLSCVNDMVKYIQLYARNGKIGDNQVIPEDVMKWMTTISNTDYSGSTKTMDNPDTTLDISVGYGLALFSGIFDGWRRIGHGGYMPPFQSSFYSYPDLGISIFVTSNGPGPLLESEGIKTEIFYLLSGLTKPREIPKIQPDHTMQHELSYYTGGKFTNPKPTKTSVSKSQIQITLDQAVGSYGSGFNGEMNITIRTNSVGIPQLYWSYGRMAEGWLVQIAPNRFVLTKWASDFWMIYWATGIGFGAIEINFLDIDTLQYSEIGLVFSTNFKKGLKLDDLPVIPWQPDSCGK